MTVLGINMTTKETVRGWECITVKKRKYYPDSIYRAQEAAQLAWDEANALTEEYMMTGSTDALNKSQLAIEAAAICDDAVRRMKAEFNRG